MTVREMLDIIDATRPNEIDDALKVRWIKDVEGRVLCEILKRSPDEVREVLGEDDVLSVPAPYARVYLLFAVSMIEFSNRNYDGYAKLCTEFEKAFELYGRWYIRNS